MSAQGNQSRRKKKKNAPPDGAPFFWLTLEILSSAAFKSLNENALKVLFRLIIEHMSHAGTENGNLICTYSDIANYGVRKPSISLALKQLEHFGFIRIQKGWAFKGMNHPSRYTLTWLPRHDEDYATNNWKRVGENSVAAWESLERTRKRVDREKRARNTRVKLSAGAVTEA